jgi:hypothetical protein
MDKKITQGNRALFDIQDRFPWLAVLNSLMAVRIP